MYYRDSSLASHLGRGLAIAVDSSHGVKIEGGSTGGVIEAVGDDANVSLTIRGKGTGGVVIGNSSSPVTLGSASGSAIRGAFSSTSTWSLAAVSSGQLGELTFASTTFDVNPGDLIGAIEVWPTASTASLVFAHYRTSTAAASRVTVVLANVASTATSTTSGHIRLSWIDLTA